MTNFRDHFSGHSADYAKYRPGYPDALFDWLAPLTKTHDLAWDVGTGSGQAAVGVVRHYRQVIATDPAQAQLRNATAHERILYKVAPAERTDLADASVDLVTVAQALHWFDRDRFFAEAKRVLKPEGAIVVWAYGLTMISPEVDPIVERCYREIVGPYWPSERIHVDNRYRTISFPFAEIDAPPFAMRAQWSLDDFIGYLDTWSASKRYAKERGANPLDLIRESLLQTWGPMHERRTVTWPLFLRAGRMPGR
jgi:SAM-dependent methyltransferase